MHAAQSQTTMRIGDVVAALILGSIQQDGFVKTLNRIIEPSQTAKQAAPVKTSLEIIAFSEWVPYTHTTLSKSCMPSTIWFVVPRLPTLSRDSRS
jgi:hypothetical protein